MNRIPTIAAAIALIALLLAAYLALSSRIARLEEAYGSSAAGAGTDPSAEFAALGYDGAGALRLRLSPRLQTAPGASPIAKDMSPAPLATPSALPAVAPAADSPAPSTAAREPVPALPAAKAAEQEEPGWFSELLGLVGVGDEPTPAEIEAGIREALSASADAALVRLSRPGGYADDEQLAIPLPQKLEAVRYVLKGVGMATLMDDLRARLNRAAELAAPDAREPLLRAIAELPLDDPLRVQGADDGATRHLRSRMSGRLTREVRPLLAQRLKEVGAYELYEQALGMYSSLPFVPPIEGDLTTYATSRSLDGIFHCLKIEEQALRANPTRHTTVALRAAFGETRD